MFHSFGASFISLGLGIVEESININQCKNTNLNFLFCIFICSAELNSSFCLYLCLLSTFLLVNIIKMHWNIWFLFSFQYLFYISIAAYFYLSLLFWWTDFVLKPLGSLKKEKLNKLNNSSEKEWNLTCQKHILVIYYWEPKHHSPWPVKCRYIFMHSRLWSLTDLTVNPQLNSD